MLRSITFIEKDYNSLINHLFRDGNEQAAFLLCRLSASNEEIRFLVRDIIPISKENIVYNDRERIEYTYESYLPVIKKAIQNEENFILVHSHPNGFRGFSGVDDEEEFKLLKFAYNRMGKGIHGSLVFIDHNTFDGRILNNTSNLYEPITKLRIIGDTYIMLNSIQVDDIPQSKLDIYNRNILAFGEGLQKLLCSMNVGVVGCGGTGSAVIEELCRMGVGKLTIVDHQQFEDTNITRMHESFIKHVGMPKVLVMEEMINNIGLNTKVNPIFEKLDNIDTVSKLKNCDLIFSCLDDTHYTRAILNLLSIYYGIPLIDTGIKFDSRNKEIYGIYGRIDIVTPNTSCLLCRCVINPQMCTAEMLSKDEYEARLKEGYAPEIRNDRVQVIPYNTLIASYSITEMIQLLTNFKGINNLHTIYRFNANKVSNEGMTGVKDRADCICEKQFVLKGDTDPLLGLCW
ncbi:MAG: ThiF family adenylyltransferase [Ruminiclostridium sp.]|nr:ThiF family adenylyltransferase [Ruminiclostridium sp.]